MDPSFENKWNLRDEQDYGQDPRSEGRGTSCNLSSIEQKIIPLIRGTEIMDCSGSEEDNVDRGPYPRPTSADDVRSDVDNKSGSGSVKSSGSKNSKDGNGD